MTAAFRKDLAKEYPAFTVYPFYHGTHQMPWASCVDVKLDKVDRIIWLAGQTGRNPETDREPQNWHEERDRVGNVVGGIKEQTTACWMRIREILEGVGARLEDIYWINFFIVDRDDKWDMLESTDEFFTRYAPDLKENPRAGVLLKGIELDLPDMRIEIEVAAAIAKK
jgi:enamine deaminase RidA (YjgF/YER057c/UK114 family)